jgi:fatty acid desaturase
MSETRIKIELFVPSRSPSSWVDLAYCVAIPACFMGSARIEVWGGHWSVGFLLMLCGGLAIYGYTDRRENLAHKTGFADGMRESISALQDAFPSKAGDA